MSSDLLIETDRSPLRPGDQAPEFTLPAGDRDGVISLAEYVSRTPLLLGFFRGTYCPFCRWGIARMGQASGRLRAEGVESLAVVATTAENARFYFRFRPPQMRVATDPEFATHRRYGCSLPGAGRRSQMPCGPHG